MFKLNKGITLIALVITIIVMLILVAVTISLSVNGGLFGYAQKANNDKIIADEKEQIGLAYFNAKMEKLGQEIDDIDMQTAMDLQIGENKAEVTLDDNDNIKIFFTDTQHTYIFDGENVIKKDPLVLHITNYDELYDFAERVNGGEDFEDYIVYLDNDIEMDVEDWIVIGRPGSRDFPANFFRGVFEGNNHTISNIIITTNRTSNGLFCGNGGTIQNLNVEGTLSGTIGTNVGMIAGGNNGTIKQCIAIVDYDLSNYNGNYSSGFGGIVGSNSGNIDKCITRGEIETSGSYTLSTGGIAGSNYNNISNCKNYANISSSGESVGGIVGEGEYSGVIEKCINHGNISGGSLYKGGIIGQMNRISIVECANKGNISNGGNNAYAGGICGRSTMSVSISNSYNVGNIECINYAVSASGISGWHSSGNLLIDGCYNVGEVSTKPIYGYTADEDDSITNCYYNNEIYTGGNEQNGTGLTTVEMKSAEFVTMLGDAFKADTNNINDGYPIFCWE